MGRGSFGAVVGGTFCGGPVAVQIPLGLRSRVVRGKRDEICDELRVLRRLRHPHIAGIHGAVMDERLGRSAVPNKDGFHKTALTRSFLMAVCAMGNDRCDVMCYKGTMDCFKKIAAKPQHETSVPGLVQFLIFLELNGFTSAFLEDFREKGLEVMYVVDPVEE